MLRGVSPETGLAAGGERALARFAPLAAIHLTALAILLSSETEWHARLAFLLTWGVLNFFWIALLRRPSVAAALSLTLVVTLSALSQFKHGVSMMTATFVDVMLIDPATLWFLVTHIPGLLWKLAVAGVLVMSLLVLLWQLDPFRIRRSLALAGGAGCFLALAALSFLVPLDREDEFVLHQYVSKFARSGVVAAVDLLTRGVLEADPSTPDRLQPGGVASCETRHAPPHIIMVFDESSFDATMMPNVVVPPGYRERFRSADGKVRSLLVEGAGGPSWYTEYNVLTGLSVRSYGRFADSVTRLAAGHVKRGLPEALRRCGYSTYSLYSWSGTFAGARSFQTATGIEHFLDAGQLGAGSADTDSFFYDQALRVLGAEQERGPVFVFVYLAMNHFPWTYRYRPDLLVDWTNPGNPRDVDEYLRRQQISLQDYTRFKQRLAREFPSQHFLLVRFGDHQPFFAKKFLEPGLDASAIAQRIALHDARYFTTYYALDGVNFQPADVSSALATLDAPHLPLVILQAAGLPLDASFAEQKRILERCHGLFYFCADGAEARRFNRLLINAGLIEGL